MIGRRSLDPFCDSLMCSYNFWSSGCRSECCCHSDSDLGNSCTVGAERRGRCPRQGRSGGKLLTLVQTHSGTGRWLGKEGAGLWAPSLGRQKGLLHRHRRSVTPRERGWVLLLLTQSNITSRYDWHGSIVLSSSWVFSCRKRHINIFTKRGIL